MTLMCDRPTVMGILNVTPDSFSDGGLYTHLDRALKRVEQMIAEGVDIVDIGGESTRPGAQPVGEPEEIDRVVPLVEAIKSRLDVAISVDSSKPGVMRAAVAAGADMLNDVRALQEEGALQAVAESRVPVCLMHMQGEPRTMQTNPVYEDVVSDVMAFLSQRIDACLELGIAKEKLVVDPGFGFGKNLSQNLTLLHELNRFKSFGLPILVGLSRKSMIGMILDKPVDQRLSASLAAATIALWQGVSILRVHDVAATVDVVKVYQAVVQHSD